MRIPTLFAAALFVSCSSTTEQSVSPSELHLQYAQEPAYTVVTLRFDRRSPLRFENPRELGAAHQACMSRLMQEGRLLITGDCSYPRANSQNREIMIFGCGVEEALAAMAQDPLVAQGGVEVDAQPFASAVPFEALAAHINDHPSAPSRNYVIARIASSDVALNVMDDPRIVWAGQACGEQDSMWLVALDAMSKAEANQLLEEIAGIEAGSVELQGWWSSEALAQFTDR